MECDGRQWPKVKAEQLRREESYKESVDAWTNFSNVVTDLTARLDQIVAKLASMDERMKKFESFVDRFRNVEYLPFATMLTQRRFLKPEESISAMEDIMRLDSPPSPSQSVSHEAVHDDPELFSTQSTDVQSSLPSTASWGTSKIQQLFQTTPSPLLVRQDNMGSNFPLSLVAASPRSIAPSDLQRPTSCPDFHTIMNTLQYYGDQQRVLSIAYHLNKHFQSKNVRISGLRANPVRLFGEDKEPFSEAEWREGDDREGLALFRVPRDRGPCSYLIHMKNRSRRRVDQQRDQAEVEWWVTDLTHFKDLFRAAQHNLGLLNLPKEDLEKVFARNHSKCSPETYDLFLSNY